MTTEKTGLTEAERISFQTEHLAWDVDGVGRGIEALARLMQASDPHRTEGYVDTPILHGLGHLLEVVGRQLSDYGKRIEHNVRDTRKQVGRENDGGFDPAEFSRRYAEACKS